MTSGGVLLEEGQKWCVYIHHNMINNKAYIGTTQQKPERRWQKGYGYKNNPYFWNSIEKYGWNNFEHIIFMSNLSQNDAAHIEKLLIALYDTTNSEYGYNVSVGGDFSHLGIKHSKETREKLRKITKERFINPENHPMYGRHHSEESKRKMSNTKMNQSEKQRQKLSEAKLGTFCNDEGNQVQITICQYDKNGNKCNDFFGISIASDKTGIGRTAISNCLCGLSHTAGGYIWKRSNEIITEDDILFANNARKGRNQSTVDGIRHDKYYDKQKKKWRARVVSNQKYKYLGTFLTEEDAMNAIIKYQNNFINKKG